MKTSIVRAGQVGTSTRSISFSQDEVLKARKEPSGGAEVELAT